MRLAGLVISRGYFERADCEVKEKESGMKCRKECERERAIAECDGECELHLDINMEIVVRWVRAFLCRVLQALFSRRLFSRRVFRVV